MVSLDTTSYDSLYDSVFTKIQDYNLAEMTKEEAFGVIADYLRPAVALFSGCTQDLGSRNDSLGEFGFRLTDTNFEILSNYMVICYLDAAYIRTPAALKPLPGSGPSDRKGMLEAALAVRERCMAENERMRINYSHRNSAVYRMAAVRANAKRGVHS